VRVLMQYEAGGSLEPPCTSAHAEMVDAVQHRAHPLLVTLPNRLSPSGATVPKMRELAHMRDNPVRKQRTEPFLSWRINYIALRIAHGLPTSVAQGAFGGAGGKSTASEPPDSFFER